MLVVEVETMLAEDAAPILQGRLRKRAVRPVGPLEGGEKATLVVDVGVVADDDAAPLDNEKYEGLSVNIRAQGHGVSRGTLQRILRRFLARFWGHRTDLFALRGLRSTVCFRLRGFALK